jgi:hypothetical protein
MRYRYYTKLIFTAVIISIILSSCTTYKPVSKGISGGYLDTPTDSRDIVIVTFYGNGYTSRLVVRQFMLMRVSELAIQRGFSNFYLAENQQQIDRTLNSYVVNNTNKVQTIERATYSAIAVLTNGPQDSLRGLPYFDASATFQEGNDLNERIKFWNYTQIGYSISEEMQVGIQYGRLGGWLYSSFHYFFFEPDFGENTSFSYLEPDSGDIFLGDIISHPDFSVTLGTQVPIINNYLYLPVGIGLQVGGYYELYDTGFFDNWFRMKTELKPIIESGVMGRFRFLYAQGVVRLIDFRNLSYSFTLGVIFNEL